MAANSKNISPLQYPTGTPIKGAIAMSNRHNWDATNQHVQDLQNQITALQTSLDALRGASAATGVSSLQALTGSLTLTSTGASVTITSPTATTINLEASGGGTVTSFSATVPSGFSANVTNASTTPALAITTTLSGILKGTGSGFTAATISDYPVFIASGASHAPGVVPDPGASAGTTKYLREDATWATLPTPSQVTQANTSVPAGNTIANTATATAFTSTGTVAANTAAVGNVYRLTLYGVYSTAVLAPTLNLSILLGSTVICTSSSVTTIGGLTNDGFRAECLVIVTTAGASGVVEAQGNVLYGTAATTALTVLMANTATISGIDFTTSNNFSAKITWGTASASNTITLRQFVIEKLS